MTETLRMTEILPRLSALHGRFDAFLVDQFGVLLDGTGAYPGAAAALSALAATGARVLLLSNSGRRSGPNVDRLLSLGFARDSFETVLSSGEVAHAILARRIGAGIPRGGKALVLSRGEGASEIEGLGLIATEDPAEADLVLISGVHSERRDLPHYEALLRIPAQRGVPAICSNPDRVSLTAAGPRFGPAVVAEAYARLGGPVEMVGKPYPAIYAEALSRLGHPDRTRVLCLGDSPEHDLAGARRAGLPACLLRTGIHAGMTDSEALALCARLGVAPEFMLPRFA